MVAGGLDRFSRCSGGSAFAFMGLWMVLPFGGLEVLALAAAIRLALRQNRQREFLYFEPERIRVERGEVGVGPRESFELPRGITRVFLEQGPYRSSPLRIVLSAPGLRASVGRYLSDDQRVTLYRRLQELIHPGWVVEPDLPRTPTWPSFED
jgi:Integral membrane protein